MGCAASSATARVAQPIQFAQVVPNDYDLNEEGRINTKSVGHSTHGAVKAGWSEADPCRRELSNQQVDLGRADVAARDAPASEPAPSQPPQPILERPVPPRLKEDEHESGRERLVESMEERGEEKHQGRVAKRSNTQSIENDREEPSKQHQRGAGLDLILSANIVSEPKSLVTWNSYDFVPSADDFALGHPIPPCAPTHKRYLRRIRKSFDYIASMPGAFQECIAKRRSSFDQRAQRLDAQTSKSSRPISRAR
eukprot:TRINITY_DN5715_c2_g1_i1.p1 TRINITY_DN5715_c2_g1~~TRINITY_DN5715_c2_g1_i1.p1  ORF type:complete len:253 (+),score=23.97 TRINITY_DN5715_c2_g1_i1:53-811(+)